MTCVWLGNRQYELREDGSVWQVISVRRWMRFGQWGQRKDQVSVDTYRRQFGRNTIERVKAAAVEQRTVHDWHKQLREGT